MTKHFLRDLDRLARAVRIQGNAAEAALEKAVTALVDGALSLAEEVIEGDAKIDERELEIESECLKILALHQPVAHDLRFLVTVLKVNHDLERIGDLAKNLAERAIYLSCHNRHVELPDLAEMSQRACAMVRESLEALFEPSHERAQAVIAADDAVDELRDRVKVELAEIMRAEPAKIEAGVALVGAARDLERIADMATNIAEDTVFLLDGELIRHAYRWPEGNQPDASRA